MIRVICFDKKIELEAVSRHLMAELGIKCHADFDTDIVHGAMHGNNYALGYIGKCWGKHQLDGTKVHMSVAVEIYDNTEAPSLDHKTTLQKKVVKKVDLDGSLDNFAKKHKIKLDKVNKHNVVIDHVKGEELIA